MSASGVFGDALRAAFGVPGCTAALAALGVAGQFGRSRLAGLGQAAFVAAGALGLAMTATLADVPLWAGLVVAVGFACGVALVQAVPIIRDAPAEVIGVVALATAEIARRITTETRPDWFGGADGLQVPAGRGGIPGGAGPFGLTARVWWAGVVGWAVVAVIAGMGVVRDRTASRRTSGALGEDPILAAAVGVDVRAVRIGSLAAAGALGAFGGLLLAAGGGRVQASAFSLDLLAVVLAGLILTGWTRCLAAAVTAATVVGCLAAARSWIEGRLGTGTIRLGSVSIIADSSRIESLQFLVMGVVLLAVVVVRARRCAGTPSAIEAADGC